MEQTITQSINQWNKQSINGSINQSNNGSNNQSITESINQSIVIMMKHVKKKIPKKFYLIPRHCRVNRQPSILVLPIDGKFVLQQEIERIHVPVRRGNMHHHRVRRLVRRGEFAPHFLQIVRHQSMPAIPEGSTGALEISVNVLLQITDHVHFLLVPSRFDIILCDTWLFSQRHERSNKINHQSVIKKN